MGHSVILLNMLFTNMFWITLHTKLARYQVLTGKILLIVPVLQSRSTEKDFKSSVEYACERSEVVSPKREDKLETN